MSSSSMLLRSSIFKKTTTAAIVGGRGRYSAFHRGIVGSSSSESLLRCGGRTNSSFNSGIMGIMVMSNSNFSSGSSGSSSTSSGNNNGGTPTTTTSTASATTGSAGTTTMKKNTFSSYMYPLAKEAPEVSHITAEEAAAAAAAVMFSESTTATTTTAAAAGNNKDMEVVEEDDPFDDRGTLSVDDRNRIRNEQRKTLNKTLSFAIATTSPTTTEEEEDDNNTATTTTTGSSSSSSTTTTSSSIQLGPITSTIPSVVPSNVSADQLEVPRAQLTTLDNGLRIVSVETYGQVSTVGIVSNLGSKMESTTTDEAGITHLLEIAGFGSSNAINNTNGQLKYPDSNAVTTTLLNWGGTRLCTTGREQSIHCVDVLRPNWYDAVGMLSDVLLQPQFHQQEVDYAVQVAYYQALDIPPEMLLGEAIQIAAYTEQQPLGQSHFYKPPTIEDGNQGMPMDGELPPLPHVDPSALRQYWDKHFVQNPNGLVLAGAGVEHERLVELADQHFGHLKQRDDGENISAGTVKESKYIGGEHYVECIGDPIDEGMVRISIGLPVGGWYSGDELVTICVLQTLLGGGSSFSAGGPGKGMYSRLYREILNRYTWAESAESFTAFYNETGIWGICGSVLQPSKARDMIQVFCEHIAKLSTDLVTDEELSRACNMLKCNVLTQLESRLVLFEDLGRQVLTYGQREDIQQTCQRIDAVTADDIRNVVNKALKYNNNIDNNNQQSTDDNNSQLTTTTTTTKSSPPISLAAVGADLSHVPKLDEVSSWFR